MGTHDLQRYFDGSELPPFGKPVKLLRGVDLMPQAEAAALSHRLYGGDQFSYPLGPLLFPHKSKLHHILFEGASGCGKSSLINQVLKDSLEHVGQGYGHRLFIWDMKGEMRLYLEPYPVGCPVNYVNPLFEHGVGIDFAKDVTTPIAAQQLAKDLIAPQAQEGQNMEWVRAARAVFSEVLKTFQKDAPEEWRLIDAFEGSSSHRNLKRVLSKSERGKAKLAGILGSDKQAAGVLMTLQGAVEEMWPLASAMAHSRNISLRDWAHGAESVLVLQHDEEYATALAGFERWVFGRAVSLAIKGATDANTTTMFFLDEVRHGPFETHLMRLATVGRGKGVGIVMGMTDIAGMNDLLNHDKAEEVLGSFSTQVLFRSNSPKTAAWTSERLGTKTVLVTEGSISMTKATPEGEAKYKAALERHFASQESSVWGSDAGGKPSRCQERIDYERYGTLPKEFHAEHPPASSISTSVNFREAQQPLVTQGEVMGFPLAELTDEHGLVAVAVVTSAWLPQPTPIHVSELNHPDVTLVPVEKEKLPNVERPASEMDFEGWKKEDEDRLKLLPLKKKAKPVEA